MVDKADVDRLQAKVEALEQELVAARLEEREACAKVAEDQAFVQNWDPSYCLACGSVAAAIRGRARP
jgi:outer membrane murein-binding lipoprotein Lpp